MVFYPGYRIVDTPGIFQKSLIQSEGSHSTKLAVREWLRKDPTGKYLSAQFRRCDCVVWALNAKFVNGAVTLEAHHELEKYGKRVIVALTKLDQVARTERERDQVLRKVERTWKDFADVHPVHAAQALKGVRTGTTTQVVESGFPALLSAIHQHCVGNKDRSRAVARYLALRATENELIAAVALLRSKAVSNATQMQSHRNLLKHARSEMAAQVSTRLAEWSNTGGSGT